MSDRYTFRDQMHRCGLQVRAWMAFLSPAMLPNSDDVDATITDARDGAGLLYEELVLAANVRCFIYEARITTERVAFGVISTGTAMISLFRDEFTDASGEAVGLSKGYRVLPLGQATGSITDNYILTRGNGDTDNLRYPFVDQIVRVYDPARTYVRGTDYELQAGPGPGGGDILHWLGSTRPVAGKTYGVLHRRFPLWEVVDANQKMQNQSGAFHNEVLPEQWQLQLSKAVG